MKSMKIALAAFAVCMSMTLAGYENFDSADKAAQKLINEKKDAEALAALKEAKTFAKQGWQKFRILTKECGIYSRQKKFTEADACMEALKKLNLKEGYLRLAVCNIEAGLLIEQGKKSEAEAVLKKALEIDGAEPYYYYISMRLAYEKLGNAQLALGFIKKIESFGKKVPEWILRRIKTVKEKIEDAE